MGQLVQVYFPGLYCTGKRFKRWKLVAYWTPKSAILLLPRENFEDCSNNEKKKDFEKREENIDVEEREKERERGSNLPRQRLASPTAQVLVAQTNQPVQKNRLVTKLILLNRLSGLSD